MKTSLRTCTGFFVLILIVLLSSASAQQKGKGRGGFGGFGGGTFGGNNLATLAGNEAVQKDLGVSGDLKEKLNSLRDDLTAARQKEYQTASINPQDFQNLTQEQRQKMNQIGNKLNDEFDPKVKALLSADQVKRLNQIRLQAAWQNQGPPALLLADVASELKLSDEQRQKLNALTMEYAQKQRELFTGGFNQEAAAKMREERTSKALDVLTAEQKEKLNSLKGNSFDVSQLGGGFGGRRGKGN
jgi:Spy/CpxP family protein refolding chaperone